MTVQQWLESWKEAVIEEAEDATYGMVTNEALERIFWAMVSVLGNAAFPAEKTIIETPTGHAEGAVVEDLFRPAVGPSL